MKIVKSLERHNVFRPYSITYGSGYRKGLWGGYKIGYIMENGREIECTNKLFDGVSKRCAFQRWLAEAEEKIRRLNDDHEINLMLELRVPRWRVEQHPRLQQYIERLVHGKELQ